MKAKLVREDVKYIVIGATMTQPDQDGIKALMRAKNHTTERDLGMHAYIHKDGTRFSPVPPDERSSILPRYGENSIFIILDGGKNAKGERDQGTFTAEQFAQLQTQLKFYSALYPNALIVLWRHLRGGFNPVFSLKDIGITDTSP